MSETALLVEATESVLRKWARAVPVTEGADQLHWPLWADLAALGAPGLLSPEHAGGAGGSVQDAVAVVRALGRSAVSAPLVETMVANWCLARCGSSVLDGPGVVLRLETSHINAGLDGGRLELQGAVIGVPWAGHCPTLLLLLPGRTGLQPVGPDEVRIVGRHNLAGEPRDDVFFDALSPSAEGRLVAAEELADDADQLITLLTTAQLAGALEQVLALTARYAREREQFGRPIARFQAVQQLLAVAAGETQASLAALESATALWAGTGRTIVLAAAKARASRAAGVVSRIAHQVHGAIGLTQEYPLHLLTRRLWSWREEAGNEFRWQETVGEWARLGGAEQLWPRLTRLQDGLVPEHAGGRA